MALVLATHHVVIQRVGIPIAAYLALLAAWAEKLFDVRNAAVWAVGAWRGLIPVSREPAVFEDLDAGLHVIEGAVVAIFGLDVPAVGASSLVHVDVVLVVEIAFAHVCFLSPITMRYVIRLVVV